MIKNAALIFYVTHEIYHNNFSVIAMFLSYLFIMPRTFTISLPHQHSDMRNIILIDIKIYFMECINATIIINVETLLRVWCHSSKQFLYLRLRDIFLTSTCVKLSERSLKSRSMMACGMYVRVCMWFVNLALVHFIFSFSSSSEV